MTHSTGAWARPRVDAAESSVVLGNCLQVVHERNVVGPGGPGETDGRRGFATALGALGKPRHVWLHIVVLMQAQVIR